MLVLCLVQFSGYAVKFYEEFFVIRAVDDFVEERFNPAFEGFLHRVVLGLFVFGCLDGVPDVEEAVFGPFAFHDDAAESGPDEFESRRFDCFSGLVCFCGAVLVLCSGLLPVLFCEQVRDLFLQPGFRDEVFLFCPGDDFSGDVLREADGEGHQGFCMHGVFCGHGFLDDFWCSAVRFSRASALLAVRLFEKGLRCLVLPDTAVFVLVCRFGFLFCGFVRGFVWMLLLLHFLTHAFVYAVEAFSEFAVALCGEFFAQFHVGGVGFEEFCFVFDGFFACCGELDAECLVFFFFCGEACCYFVEAGEGFAVVRVLEEGGEEFFLLDV